MSWKEVFRELSDMEGIVQRMEEENEEQENREGTEEDKEVDLNSKLMREIKDFDKKTQLRNVTDSGKVLDGDVNDDGVETINISPDDVPPQSGGGTRFNFDFKPGDRISLIDRSEKLVRRGSGHSGSGILRRPSLGVEPVSPAAASADRLSVTFANETVVVQDEVTMEEEDVEDKDPVSLILGSLKRTISTASGLRRGSLSSVDHKTYVSFDSPEPDIAPPEIPCDHHEDGEDSNEDNDEDEYSSGIREILDMNQSLDVRRRSSGGSRRSRRLSTVSGMLRSSSRPTSRHSEESRRSESVYENLKLHREVVDQVKYQIWPLDKKLRMVRQAKLFVSQHEKEMKNQLKSDKSFGSYAKQFWIRTVEIFFIVIRWIREHLDYLIPWEGRIKRIESQFGSVVSSYFLFLRWVVYVNLIITVVIMAFIILPELLSGHWEGSGIRKQMLSIEEKTSRNLKVLWDFEGILRYSPLFYGWYGNQAKSKTGYETPQAYFIVMMVVYIFSFVIILRKMQEVSNLLKNSKKKLIDNFYQANKQSKLSEKADEATFTWKIFCSWDYGIANVEAAHNKVSAIVMGLREAILEANESERDKEQDWRTIAKRGSSWFFFVLSLIGSAYCVVLVVDR